MKRKAPSSISISSLARFAAKPSCVLDKVNAGAVKYGNRAHSAIGKGPSLAAFLILAVAVIAAAKFLGVF